MEGVPPLEVSRAVTLLRFVQLMYIDTSLLGVGVGIAFLYALCTVRVLSILLTKLTKPSIPERSYVGSYGLIYYFSTDHLDEGSACVKRHHILYSIRTF